MHEYEDDQEGERAHQVAEQGGVDTEARPVPVLSVRPHLLVVHVVDGRPKFHDPLVASLCLPLALMFRRGGAAT
jgi:hypothetical protein